MSRCSICALGVVDETTQDQVHGIVEKAHRLSLGGFINAKLHPLPNLRLDKDGKIKAIDSVQKNIPVIRNNLLGKPGRRKPGWRPQSTRPASLR